VPGLPVEDGGDVAGVLEEEEVAVAVVTVQQRHVVDRWPVFPQPRTRESDGRVGLVAVLPPHPVPQRDAPVDRVGGPLARDLERGQVLARPVKNVQGGEVPHELRGQRGARAAVRRPEAARVAAAAGRPVTPSSKELIRAGLPKGPDSGATKNARGAGTVPCTAAMIWNSRSRLVSMTEHSGLMRRIIRVVGSSVSGRSRVKPYCSIDAPPVSLDRPCTANAPSSWSARKASSCLLTVSVGVGW
jgi:hypothetical protein